MSHHGPNARRGGAPSFADARPSATLTRTRDAAAFRHPGYPLVSIVTVVRNAEATLERAVRSLRSQTYPAIEHIVVDGASTDGTLGIIRANLDWIAAWSSEPDAGLYDAMNKGIAACTGEIIGILNADDWYEPQLIEAAVDELARSGADFVFGDIWMHGYRGQDFRMPGDPDYARVVRRDVPRTWHTTMMCRRLVYERAGLYRTDMRVASDYDWQIRVFNAGCRGVYAEDVVAHVTAGGVSTAMQRTAIREGFLCCVRNGYPIYKALPYWTYRWIANDHPQLHQRLHRARVRLRAVHAAAGRQTTRSWHALGPLRRLLPGKTLAMRLLGLQPTGPEAVAPVLTPPSPPQLGREQPPESRIAAFIEARHHGTALPDRAIEALIDRSVIWSWVVVRGDHAAAAQIRSLAVTLGLPLFEMPPDQGPGLLADFTAAPSDALPAADLLTPVRASNAASVLRLTDDLCLLPARAAFA